MFILEGMFMPGMLIMIIIPLLPYWYYQKKVYNRLEDKVFNKLQFSPIPLNQYTLSNYSFSKIADLHIDKVVRGNFEGQAINLVSFTLSIGEGKNKRSGYYTGVELQTSSNIEEMKIYDTENTMRPGIINRLRGWKLFELESREFNRLFEIYTDHPTDAFYNVHPDTMMELIDLRKEFGNQINVEFHSNHILVYTTNHHVQKLLDSISFTEALNDEHGEDDEVVFQETISALVRFGQKVFSMMNVKAASKT